MWIRVFLYVFDSRTMISLSVSRWPSVLDLALHLIRPKKKGMRLDVRMKRLAAPYPRNIHKKRDLPPSNTVLRELFGDS